MWYLTYIDKMYASSQAVYAQTQTHYFMLPSPDSEKICILALIQTPGVGAVTIRQLISYCGGAANVFSADFKKLIKIPGVGEKVAKAILSKITLSAAEFEWAQCEQAGVNLHFFTDNTYPHRLKPLYDAPIALYSMGRIDFNAVRTVGIVGTRQISEYGKSMTESLIRDLEPYQPLVVSGLAYGVDITAHRACLKHQLPTVGVLANGVDIIYPAAHQKTAREML